MQSLVQFKSVLLHLQHKVLHPVLHLNAMITSSQDSGTGDNNTAFVFLHPSSNPCLRDLVSWDRPNELAFILLLDNEHVECESIKSITSRR